MADLKTRRIFTQYGVEVGGIYKSLVPNSKGTSLMDAEDINDGIICAYTPSSYEEGGKMKYRYSFMKFACVRDLYNAIDKLPSNLRCFYEVCCTEPIKIYFDLEMEKKTYPHLFSKENAEEMKDCVIESLNQVLGTLDIKLSFEKDIIIFTAHNEAKFSYHIILRNHAFVGTHTTKACKELAELAKRVVSLVPDKYKGMIDLSVYTPHQQFRMPLCQKLKSNRPKDPCFVWNYKGKEIIMDFLHNDPRKTMAESDIKLMSSILFENSLICVHLRPPVILPPFLTPVVQENKQENEHEKQTIDIDMKELSIFVPEGWELRGTSCDGCFPLKKISKVECRVCHRFHDSENQYLVVVGEKQQIYFKCHRDNTLKEYLGALAPGNTEEKAVVPEEKAVVPEEKAVKANTFNSPDVKMTMSNFMMKWHSTTLHKDNYKQFEKELLQCCRRVNSGEGLIIKVESIDNVRTFTTLSFNQFKNLLKAYVVVIEPWHPLYPQTLLRDKKKPPSSVPMSMYQIFMPILTKHACERIVFNPCVKNVKSDEINLFTGLRAKRLEKYIVENIAVILNHIKEVFCQNQPILCEYFLNKLAFYFQNLGKRKTEVADVIIGQQGCGKNIFYECIGKYVLGELYMYITADVEKLIGRFNECLNAKLLIIGDEAKGHGKASEGLKHLITQQTRWVEPKGKEQFQIQDFSLNVFLANNSSFFQIDEGDRRYFTLSASGKYIGNRAYFDQLVECFTKHADTFYSFFMDRDISKFNLLPIPVTSVKEEIVTLSQDPVIAFHESFDWHSLQPNKFYLEKDEEKKEETITAPRSRNTYKRALTQEVKYPLAEYYDQFIYWTDVNGIQLNKAYSKRLFSAKLSQYWTSERGNMKVMLRPPKQCDN